MDRNSVDVFTSAARQAGNTIRGDRAVERRSREKCAAKSQAKTTAKIEWLELREEAAGCRDCPLGHGTSKTVWGDGQISTARLMLVGDQPEFREDIAGRPFVGPAGRLLDRAIGELHWPRDAVYVTHAVKHLSVEIRGQRRRLKTPGDSEVAACSRWLEAEIRTVAPIAIVALGRIAASALLGRPIRAITGRGRWFERSDGIQVLVTIHPGALLRSDAVARASAYRDWLVDLSQATTLLTPSRAA